MLDEKNKTLIAKGGSPIVMGGYKELIDTFFGDGTYVPLVPEYNDEDFYFYTPRDVAKALYLIRKKYAPKTDSKSGLKKKSKSEFSLNIVFFASKQTGILSGLYPEKFEELAKICKGESRLMTGLDSIKISLDED